MATANCNGCPKPKAAIPVGGLNCAGQKVTIINPPSIPAPTQTVAHPDSVQRVLICNPDSLGGGAAAAQRLMAQEAYVATDLGGGHIGFLPHTAVAYLAADGSMQYRLFTLTGTEVLPLPAVWGLGTPPELTASYGTQRTDIGWYIDSPDANGAFFPCLVVTTFNDIGAITNTTLQMPGSLPVNAASVAPGFWGYGVNPRAGRQPTYHNGWVIDGFDAVPCVVEITSNVNPAVSTDAVAPIMRIIRHTGPGAFDYYVAEPGEYGTAFGLGEPPRKKAKMYLPGIDEFTGTTTGGLTVGGTGIQEVQELTITHLASDPCEFSLDGGTNWFALASGSISWKAAENFILNTNSIQTRGTTATSKYRLHYTY